MKKIDELVKEKQKYIKEKQTIEQELNKKEQELNKKEQKLVNNKKEINNLEFQNKLLKERLDNLEKSNDLKNKENNKLKNEIEKLKKDKDSNTMPKMLQDDKSKIFIPYDNKYESNVVKNLTEKYTNLIEKEKYIDEPKLKKLDPEYMVELTNIGKDGTFKKIL